MIRSASSIAVDPVALSVAPVANGCESKLLRLAAPSRWIRRIIRRRASPSAAAASCAGF